MDDRDQEKAKEVINILRRETVILLRGEAFARGAGIACVIIACVETLRPRDNLAPMWGAVAAIFFLIVFAARRLWPWLAESLDD